MISSSSYYCTQILDPIKRLNLQIRHIQTTKAESGNLCEDLGREILRLMSLVCSSGVEPWSIISQRRLIPIHYWYNEGGLIDIVDPVGEFSLELIELIEKKQREEIGE